MKSRFNCPCAQRDTRRERSFCPASLEVHPTLMSCIFSWVLKRELRALCRPGRHCSTELHSGLCGWLLLVLACLSSSDFHSQTPLWERNLFPQINCMYLTWQPGFLGLVLESRCELFYVEGRVECWLTESHVVVGTQMLALYWQSRKPFSFSGHQCFHLQDENNSNSHSRFIWPWWV